MYCFLERFTCLPSSRPQKARLEEKANSCQFLVACCFSSCCARTGHSYSRHRKSATRLGTGRWACHRIARGRIARRVGLAKLVEFFPPAPATQPTGGLCFSYLEQLSSEYGKTKSKVITLTNHNRRKHRKKPGNRH